MSDLEPEVFTSGARAVFDPVPGARTAAVAVVLDAGSRNERPEEAGSTGAAARAWGHAPRPRSAARRAA
ncbi:MAG: hypothetical protein AAFV51_10240, partial [Pseudomonadota bacterium]